MPGFDRSGPFGQGAMTGGARGYCNAASTGYRASASGYPGSARPMGGARGPRRGMGFRARGGFGRRFSGYRDAYSAPYAMDAGGELEMLKAQAASVKQSLDAIYQRMAELEKSSE